MLADQDKSHSSGKDPESLLDINIPNPATGETSFWLTVYDAVIPLVIPSFNLCTVTVHDHTKLPLLSCSSESAAIPLQALIHNWHRYPTPPDINASSTGKRCFIGHSVLFLAAILAQHDQPALLQQIIRDWSRLNPNVNLQAKTGDVGMSVLWYATRLAEQHKPDLLNIILATWDTLSPAPNLEIWVSEGKQKGKSLLYQAVVLAKTLGDTRLLMRFAENPFLIKRLSTRELPQTQADLADLFPRSCATKKRKPSSEGSELFIFTRRALDGLGAPASEADGAPSPY